MRACVRACVRACLRGGGVEWLTRAVHLQAFRKFELLSKRHVESLRKFLKHITDARVTRDNDRVQVAVKEYNEALERCALVPPSPPHRCHSRGLTRPGAGTYPCSWHRRRSTGIWSTTRWCAAPCGPAC